MNLGQPVLLPPAADRFFLIFPLILSSMFEERKGCDSLVYLFMQLVDHHSGAPVQ